MYLGMRNAKELPHFLIDTVMMSPRCYIHNNTINFRSVLNEKEAYKEPKSDRNNSKRIGGDNDDIISSLLYSHL